MGNIVMAKGQYMQLRVDSITPNVKQVRKGNEVYQRHDIYLSDPKTGNTLRGEFLNMSLTPDGFVLGVIQYVRCIWWDEKGPTIEPYDPVSPNSPPVQRDSLPKQNVELSNANQDIASNQQVQHAINSDLNVGGKAIVFAMAYAKDLKVAEVARQKMGYKVTDKDIEDVIAWGKQITMGILDIDLY